jgi:hypothetical protein
MAALDNSLTTLARAKSFMEISGGAKDLVLTMIIAGVSAYIQDSYLRRKLKRTTYTNEIHSGKNSHRIWVRNGPIIEGQTITLEHRSGANEWQTIPTGNYLVDYNKGTIELLKDTTGWEGTSAMFREGTQNYRVSYTGGYYLPSNVLYQDGTNDELDLPFDIELATLDLISAVYNLRTSGAIKEKSVGDARIVYASEMDKHPTIKSSLDRYRVMGYGE